MHENRSVLTRPLESTFTQESAKRVALLFGKGLSSLNT